MQEKNKEISFIKHNMLKYLKLRGISNKECYEKTGISEGILSQKNGITEDNLLKFLNFYKDINLNFLFYREGEVLNESNVPEVTPSDNSNELKLICNLSAENALLKKEIEDLRYQKKTNKYHSNVDRD